MMKKKREKVLCTNIARPCVCRSLGQPVLQPAVLLLGIPARRQLAAAVVRVSSSFVFPLVARLWLKRK